MHSVIPSQFVPLFEDVDLDMYQDTLEPAAPRVTGSQVAWTVENSVLCSVLLELIYERKLHIERTMQDEKWDELANVTHNHENFVSYETKNGLQLRAMFLTKLCSPEMFPLKAIFISGMVKFAPTNFRIITNAEWSKFPGVLAGSSEICSYFYGASDDEILMRYKTGISIDKCGVDFELLDILCALYCQGIRAIYNLTTYGSRNQELIGCLWEGEFDGTVYVSSVKGVPVRIEVGTFLLFSCSAGG